MYSQILALLTKKTSGIYSTVQESHILTYCLQGTNYSWFFQQGSFWITSGDDIIGRQKYANEVFLPATNEEYINVCSKELVC